ncbi:MAG: hypothetical protein R2809_00275 [Flavobacteriales bacterium]
MQKTKFDFGLLIILFITIVFSFLMYGDVMLHPDMYMFSNTGDGIKNYFTFAWHVRYDESWIAFSGSNYPYGEHVGYSDGHSLLSLLFGGFDFVKEHPIGFLNSIMIYSPIFASSVLYKVLRRLDVSMWVAIVGAFCILLMQPQLVRMTGHYSLSYSWVIPLFILLFLIFQKSNRVLQIVIYSAYITAIFFIHPYLGMGLALFACCVWLVQIIVAKWKKEPANFSLLLGGVVSVIFYAAFSKITDTHLDRYPLLPKDFWNINLLFSRFFYPITEALNRYSTMKISIGKVLLMLD